MERYQRLVSSLFNDGVVNIGRICVVLMFTVYLIGKDPVHSKDYWLVLYDTLIEVSTRENIIRREQQQQGSRKDLNGTILPVSR